MKTQSFTHVVALAACLVATTFGLACDDKKKEEAEKKEMESYAEKIEAKVDEICGCNDQSCAETKNRELTAIQDEAKAKFNSWPTPVHSRLMPSMERVGQCLAAKL